MGKAQDDLGVVGKLPRETIFKIADLVDENIITEGDIAGIKDVLGDTNVSIRAIVRVFHNIARRKDNPKTFMEFVNTTNLTDKEKDALRDVMKKVHNKLDADKITTNMTALHLEVFGHMHMDRNSAIFPIVTEFRPLSKNGKIIKMTPSLVVDIPLHDPREKDGKSINFHMDLEDAEWLADLLNRNIKTLKAEIQQIREKFGSDVI